MNEELIVSRSNPLQRVKPDAATVLARIALACLVVGALLWGALVGAAEVSTCTVETLPGAGCNASGGDNYWMDETEWTTQAILVCRVSVAAGSDWSACVDGDSDAYEYVFVESLQAGDWVFFAGGIGYVLFEETSFFEGGEEPPPETTPSWVPELRVEDAVKLWGAALLLLAIGFVGAILRRAMSLR